MARVSNAESLMIGFSSYSRSSISRGCSRIVSQGKRRKKERFPQLPAICRNIFQKKSVLPYWRRNSTWIPSISASFSKVKSVSDFSRIWPIPDWKRRRNCWFLHPFLLPRSQNSAGMVIIGFSPRFSKRQRGLRRHNLRETFLILIIKDAILWYAEKYVCIMWSKIFTAPGAPGMRNAKKKVHVIYKEDFSDE